MEHEDELKQKLQDLQKQLGKKQMFEEAVASIRSLLHENYLSCSPSLKHLASSEINEDSIRSVGDSGGVGGQFFTVISRVATILKTRYTSPGFWTAGLGLFLEAEQLVSESSEKKHLHTCIARAREQLSEIDNQPDESTQIEETKDCSRYYIYLTVYVAKSLTASVVGPIKLDDQLCRSVSQAQIYACHRMGQ
ncbi:hypothetical protein Tco_1432156 [Tanacetum coccineum]